VVYSELFESVIRKAREDHSSLLFERVLMEFHLKEMVVVESGRIYIYEIDEKNK